MQNVMEKPPELAAAPNTAETGNVVKDIDYLLAPISVDRFGKLHFCVDDVPFEVAHTNLDGTCRIRFQATLGYLPFSVESVERRNALLTILLETRNLYNVIFQLSPESRIIAIGAFEVEDISSINYVFHPLMRFMQEAGPFFKLIRKYT